MREGDLLIDGPKNSTATVVLAHGAGATMDSPFMNTIAEGLAKTDIRVVRFEFPYMRARRESGRRGAPDREAVLLDVWRGMIARVGGGGRLVIGGKSMGGRIASMVADEVGARGLVCLGYPFHPPGRPVGRRTKHLEELHAHALIVQGTRDQFGQRQEVAGCKLSAKIKIVWIEDGDHSFKPRARSGRTEAQNLAEAIAAVSEFVSRL
jgi:predicted alpha/beta-hydrolase family hydrolase